MERNNTLVGLTAVITGAGSGIGKAIALRLAECGADVVLLGGRTVGKLEAVADMIRSSGVRCLTVSGDLTDEKFRENGIKTIADTFGKVDVLINNAGSALGCPFEEVTEAQFDEIMELDVKVPFFLTQKMLPYIRKSDRGTIINIASVVAHSGYPNQSVYSAAKHALLGFTQSLAREVYKEGIRVHVISPGGVFTDMVKLTRPDLTGDNMILPEDIADAVEFLLTRRGNAVIDEISLHRMNKEPF